MYGVFERSQAYPLILSQAGRFNQSLLAMTVWRDYGEEDQRLFLSLMESCGIIFRHRSAEPRYGTETEYLAPDLLMDSAAAAHQLAGRWNETERSWRLEYEYPSPPRPDAGADLRRGAAIGRRWGVLEVRLCL